MRSLPVHAGDDRCHETADIVVSDDRTRAIAWAELSGGRSSRLPSASARDREVCGVGGAETGGFEQRLGDVLDHADIDSIAELLVDRLVSRLGALEAVER